MGISQRIAAGAVSAAVLAGGGIAVSAPAASASTAPAASTRPVVYQTFGRFSGPVMVRPGRMMLGTAWGFKRASWQRWTGTSASGHAREWVYPGGAAHSPRYQWHVSVTFQRVRHHDGRAYFTRMKLEGKPPAAVQRLGVKRVQHLKYAGGWIQY